MPTLRHLLATQPYVFAPLCYNPLSARLAEEVGFQAVYLGGGSYGATLTWTEAMLTVTELADMTHRCATTVNIPIIVDGAGGFGEPLHVMRTIREIEQAGGAAIEIEDQRIPKRAHHHKGLEHMISKEEMADKIQAACEARKSQDFIIIARSNGIRNTGMTDAIDRCLAYREAGADMIFACRAMLQKSTRLLSHRLSAHVHDGRWRPAEVGQNRRRIRRRRLSPPRRSQQPIAVRLPGHAGL